GRNVTGVQTCALPILVVDPEESERELDAILGPETVRPAKLFERIFEKDSCIIIQANRQIQHIFQELYNPPKHGETAYYRLKTAEIGRASCRDRHEIYI